MDVLRVSLFGKFEASYDGKVLACFDTGKVLELFCYLLLHRDRPHPREAMAGLLWEESSTEQSLRYLRKTLWQFHAALDAETGLGSNRMLVAGSDSVQLNSDPQLWLDTAEFERAFNGVRGVAGPQLSTVQAQSLKAAVELYRGHLLEGWYQDWCLYERERLQQIYLTMLDKLMGKCEAQGDCETGTFYGDLILRCDPARERTHRRLMRLYYRSGDRTAALRQYQHCVTSLRKELSVRPSRRTVELCQQIRADQFGVMKTTQASARSAVGLLPDLLRCLNQLQASLTRAQDQIRQETQKVEAAMDGEN